MPPDIDNKLTQILAEASSLRVEVEACRTSVTTILATQRKTFRVQRAISSKGGYFTRMDTSLAASELHCATISHDLEIFVSTAGMANSFDVDLKKLFDPIEENLGGLKVVVKQDGDGEMLVGKDGPCNAVSEGELAVLVPVTINMGGAITAVKISVNAALAVAPFSQQVFSSYQSSTVEFCPPLETQALEDEFSTKALGKIDLSQTIGLPQIDLGSGTATFYSEAAAVDKGWRFFASSGKRPRGAFPLAPVNLPAWSDTILKVHNGYFTRRIQAVVSSNGAHLTRQPVVTGTGTLEFSAAIELELSVQIACVKFGASVRFEVDLVLEVSVKSSNQLRLRVYQKGPVKKSHKVWPRLLQWLFDDVMKKVTDSMASFMTEIGFDDGFPFHSAARIEPYFSGDFLYINIKSKQ